MTRLASIVLLATAVLAGWPLAGNAADAKDPLLGSWQLDTSKSTFNPGPGPKGQMRTYTHEGDIERLLARGVGDDGKPTHVTYTARYDGKDYPIRGSAGGDQISLRRIDAYTTESTEKRNGKAVIVATRTVSPDGKTLTVITKGIGPSGEKLDHRMIFEKR